jgi:hypothetical protein
LHLIKLPSATVSLHKHRTDSDTPGRPFPESGLTVVLLRANRTVVLALLWTALAACIAGSLVVDVADWLDAWRDLLIVMMTAAAAV